MSMRSASPVFDRVRFIDDVHAYLKRHRVGVVDMSRACGMNRGAASRVLAGRQLSLLTASLFASFCDLSLDAYVINPFAVEAAA